MTNRRNRNEKPETPETPDQENEEVTPVETEQPETPAKSEVNPTPRHQFVSGPIVGVDYVTGSVNDTDRL